MIVSGSVEVQRRVVLYKKKEGCLALANTVFNCFHYLQPKGSFLDVCADML